MKYISDIIGEDYKNWCNDKSVIIHAPTGSGKTYFVLHKLLEYVKSRNKTMVFVTNRTALKEQIKNEIKSIDPELVAAITVTTYQHLAWLYIPYDTNRTEYEENDDMEKLSEEDQAILKSDYIIFDEAHFFLADAEFNERVTAVTEKILQLIAYKKRISIFMTATIEYVYLYINALYESDPQMMVTFPRLKSQIILNSSNFKFNRHSLNLYDMIDHSEKYEHNENAPLPERVISAEKRRFQKESQSYWNVYAIREENLKRFPMFSYPCFNAQNAKTMEDGKTSKGKLEQDYDKYKDEFRKLQERLPVYPKNGDLQNINDFSYVRPWYYESESELVEIIFSTPENEKWLIFVNSKTQGNSLLKKIRTREKDQKTSSDGKWNSEFVYSESKKPAYESNMTYKELIQDEKFSKRVLIATKVLDNGVNIKDDDVKHVVIVAYNKTDFIQMLGRKRRKENETVNVYLMHRTEKSMYHYINNTVIRKLGFVQMHNELRGFIDKTHNLDYALRYYIDNYTHSGKIRSEFSKCLSLSDKLDQDYTTSTFVPRTYSSMHHIIKAYKVNPYFENKIIFDYYENAAQLENARRQRYPALRDWCIEQCYYDVAEKRDCENNTELWQAYVNQENTLSNQQYTWLRYQLSWMNLDGCSEFDPCKPDRWINGHLHNFEENWNNLCRFITNHMKTPSGNYLVGEQIDQFQLLIYKVRNSMKHQTITVKKSKSREVATTNDFLLEQGINLYIIDRSTDRLRKWELKRHIENVK